MMNRRRLRGQVPQVSVSFGEVDPSPLAPLHRRLGIRTVVYRVAILGNFNKRTDGWDAVNRVGSNDHLYRASVTLARI